MVSDARGRACGARGASENERENAPDVLFPPAVGNAQQRNQSETQVQQMRAFFSRTTTREKLDDEATASFTRRRATRLPPSARDDAYRRPRALGGCRYDCG
jgi:hypothetical protein